MRPSNKSRNRNKNNNRRGTAGNNINRVFDSSGPEGRVRGTPQQIIDKYISLTYDSQLSGDRVAAENFQQHAEHYSRLLIEAQKELAEKQVEQNSNTVSNKTVGKVVEDGPVTLESPVKTIDTPDETVINFGKNVEPVEVNDRIDSLVSKPQRKSTARKVVKKQTEIRTTSLEVK